MRGANVEIGQLLFVLLIGVPVTALAVLCSLWLIFVVKRPILGVLGLAIIGATYSYGDGVALLRIVPGILACVAATGGSGKTLSARMRKAKPSASHRS